MFSKHNSSKRKADLLELADEIEKSTGLFRMIPGQGTIEFGITKVMMIVNSLRSEAER